MIREWNLGKVRNEANLNAASREWSTPTPVPNSPKNEDKNIIFSFCFRQTIKMKAPSTLV